MFKANEETLKSCPFCNEDFSVDLIDDGVLFWVECEACGASTKPFDEDHQAADAWNRRAAGSEQQAAQQDERIVKLEQAYKELSNIFHDQIVAQQAAWIEWQHGAGAEAGMQWIENGLCGPGHIPDEDEPYGKESQAWYDANNSDPFPVCQCGRPSNMMWMGMGFCCQAHYDAARSSNGGK